MSTPATGTSKADLPKFVRTKLLQNAAIHYNLDQELIFITGDKLELCIRKHSTALSDKFQWVTPAGLLISFVITFVTCDFKDALWLKASVWQAFFMFLSVATLGWLIVALIRSFRFKTSIEILIKEIKQLSGNLPDQVEEAQDLEG